MSKNKKREQPLLNIGVNIVIPAMIMMKGGKWFGMSPEAALGLALVLPLAYGLHDLVIKKKYNFLSILGFTSILLTGGIGLMKLPKEWIAIKEAAVPFIIGLAILISQKTPTPLVRTFLFNDAIMDVDRINTRLQERQKESEFTKLMGRATWIITASFMLSTVLNFSLAKVLIKSETGTQAFIEELGQMTVWSYPVIALPCTLFMVVALWHVFKGTKDLTGLEFEEIFKQQGNKQGNGSV